MGFGPSDLVGWGGRADLGLAQEVAQGAGRQSQQARASGGLGAACVPGRRVVVALVFPATVDGGTTTGGGARSRGIDSRRWEADPVPGDGSRRSCCTSSSSGRHGVVVPVDKRGKAGGQIGECRAEGRGSRGKRERPGCGPVACSGEELQARRGVRAGGIGCG